MCVTAAAAAAAASSLFIFLVNILRPEANHQNVYSNFLVLRKVLRCISIYTANFHVFWAEIVKIAENIPKAL